jgi:hypothetical protein
MRCCVVSGCDAKYFPFLVDLLDSLAPVRVDVAVADFGLLPEQRQAIAARGAKLIGFRYPLDFPARRQVEAEFPSFGGYLIRPYLDQCLPDHDVIMWVDSDVWAQWPPAIPQLFREAARFGFAAIPEVHRVYLRYLEGPASWEAGYRTQARCFGADIADKMRLIPPINSGLLAIRRDFPLWQAWRQYLHRGLQGLRKIDDETRMVEQVALNVAVRLHQLPVRRFPTSYNWMPDLGGVLLDLKKGLLVEPQPPYEPLRMIHLSTHVLDTIVPVPTTQGEVVETALTYRAITDLRRRSSAE